MASSSFLVFGASLQVLDNLNEAILPAGPPGGDLPLRSFEFWLSGRQLCQHFILQRATRIKRNGVDPFIWVGMPGASPAWNDSVQILPI